MNSWLIRTTLGLIFGLVISSQTYAEMAQAEVVANPQPTTNPTTQAIANSNKSKSSNPELNAKLLIAAKNGQLQEVRSLISQATDVNVRDEYGWTPLLWAAMNGHTDIVRVLLVSGANPNTRNKYEWTPLMWAAGQGYTEIVRSLVSFGARINAQDRNGWTALMWAWDSNQPQIVAILKNPAAIER